MGKSVVKKTAMVILLSIIFGQISVFSQVYAKDVELISQEDEELKLFEESLEEALEFLENEIEVEDSKNDRAGLENLSIKEDLRELENLEEVEEIKTSSPLRMYSMEVASIDAVVENEKDEKTEEIKNKLTGILDTIDILELERLKASYSAEAEIAGDIGETITNVLSLYTNISQIKDFKSAIASIKSIIQDIKTIKHNIQVLKLKINVNKLDRNLNLRYISQIENHIEKRIFDKTIQNELRLFYIKRLDSSVNKELLKLEAKSHKSKLYANQGDIESIELRLDEIKLIINYTDKYIKAHYDDLKNLENLDRYLENTYQIYIDTIIENLVVAQNDVDSKDNINLDIAGLFDEINSEVVRLKGDFENINYEDIEYLKDILARVDYYISTQSIGKSKTNNKKLYKTVKSNIDGLYKIIEINEEIAYIVDKYTFENEYSKTFEKEVNEILTLINSQEKDIRDRNLEKIDEVMTNFNHLKNIEEAKSLFNDLEGKINKVKVSKFTHAKKLDKLNEYRDLIKTVETEELQDKKDYLLELIEDKEMELNNLYARLNVIYG